jgi:hypothetical protein
MRVTNFIISMVVASTLIAAGNVQAFEIDNISSIKEMVEYSKIRQAMSENLNTASIEKQRVLQIKVEEKNTISIIKQLRDMRLKITNKGKLAEIDALIYKGFNRLIVLAGSENQSFIAMTEKFKTIRSRHKGVETKARKALLDSNGEEGKSFEDKENEFAALNDAKSDSWERIENKTSLQALKIKTDQRITRNKIALERALNKLGGSNINKMKIKDGIRLQEKVLLSESLTSNSGRKLKLYHSLKYAIDMSKDLFSLSSLAELDVESISTIEDVIDDLLFDSDAGYGAIDNPIGD